MTRRKLEPSSTTSPHLLFTKKKDPKFGKLLKDIKQHLNENDPEDNKIQTVIQGQKYSQALRLACLKGRNGFVQRLIDYLNEANLSHIIDQPSPKSGKTPLHYAVLYSEKAKPIPNVKMQDYSIVTTLIMGGAKTDIRDKEGKLFTDYHTNRADRDDLNALVDCLLSPDSDDENDENFNLPCNQNSLGPFPRRS